MKVFLVSPNPIGLGEFLNSKDGIEVVQQIPNIYSKVNDLMQIMVIADRLLYLCTADNTSFTKDLAALSDLLSAYHGMFKITEFIFFLQLDKSKVNYVDYIEAIFKEFPNQKYSIIKTKDKIGYPEAYNALMGKSNLSANEKMTETIYVKNRGSQAKAIYSAQKVNYSIIPFDYTNQKEYDNLKKSISIQDSSDYIKESTQEENLKSTENSPYLGKITVSGSKTVKNIILFTGDTGVGTTAYFTAMTVAASKGNEPVFLLNYKNDETCFEYLSKDNQQFSEQLSIYDTKDLLLLYPFKTSNNLGCFMSDNLSDESKLATLPYILKHPTLQNALLFIEVEPSILLQVSEILSTNLLQIIVVTEGLKMNYHKDLLFIKSLINENFPVSVWINRNSRVRDTSYYLNDTELQKFKEQYQHLHLLHDIKLQSCNCSLDLFRSAFKIWEG